MSFYSSYQQSGYILTTSLVECIYHIAPEHKDQSSPIDKYAIRKALSKADGLLRRLSQTVGSASRALRALHCVLRADEPHSQSMDWFRGLTASELDPSSYPMFESLPNWTDEIWDTPETRRLHNWLNNPAEDQVSPPPTSTKPTQMVTTTLNPLQPDATGCHNSLDATPHDSSSPSFFYNDAIITGSDLGLANT